MKKIVLPICLLVGSSVVAMAQSDELKSATAKIEKKEFISALDDLNKAKKKITDLISSEIGSVLPAKFGDYEMQPAANRYGVEGQGVSVLKNDSKPQPKIESKEQEGAIPTGAMNPATMMAQEQISVQITTNMMMASEVMNAHAMSDEGAGNPNIKAFRVKGYRAILRTSDGMRMGATPAGGGSESKIETAQAIVGGAFISVETRGLKEAGQAEKLLNLIDLEKLKGIVGE